MTVKRVGSGGPGGGCLRRAWRWAVVPLAALSVLPAWAAGEGLADKTLVAWASPANLTQRGGSVLTIEKPRGVFDAIVFGEIAPGRWMAGSDLFRRSARDQGAWPAESVGPESLVQVAVVYRGRAVSIYRNGRPYARYQAGGAERFGDDSLVVLGLRHRDALRRNCFFLGGIDDARIYNSALSAEQVAALKPNDPAGPKPYAWWDFESGRTADRMGLFPVAVLAGGARVAGGRLLLEKPGAYMLALRRVPRAGEAPMDLRDVNAVSRALREKLLADPHRPGYHFVILEGRAMPFDPNGAIYWKGRYHLFYIFQDRRGHNWGHVSSTDLVHWRHHPTGLTGGMFSGNCFLDKAGRPTMCYHQVGQGNAMAVALDDELNRWKKLQTNPITPKTAPGDPHHGKYRSWDPYGWVEGDTYYAIFGGKRPAVAKAKDLAGPWHYVGDLMANAVEGVSINEDVSCADFFRLGGRHVLLCISHRLGCRYYVGDWRGEQFHPTFHERMSWVDNSFFAPESLLDAKGRRIMWAWIFDYPGFKTRNDYGWSGTMSLPRVLTLGPDGRLRMNPPDELKCLRYNPRSREDISVAADGEIVVEGVEGDSIELDVEMAAPKARRFGVKVCCSPDAEEQTPVFYDADAKKLTVDTTKSSLAAGAGKVEAGPFALGADEPLRLRVFVDRSVVEVFANDGRQAVMRRIYPSRPDSVQVRVFSRGGPAKVTRLRAWEMMPSSPY